MECVELSPSRGTEGRVVFSWEPHSRSVVFCRGVMEDSTSLVVSCRGVGEDSSGD